MNNGNRQEGTMGIHKCSMVFGGGEMAVKKGTQVGGRKYAGVRRAVCKAGSPRHA